MPIPPEKIQALQAKLRFQQPDSGFSLDVELDLPGQGITAIFGQSGCGKTTLLRCIAGLEPKAQGFLCLNGEIWQNEHINLPTHRRPLAYVFQEASLFPHLSVAGNLRYAVKRATKADRPIAFDTAVELLSIVGLLSRRPDQLSGGERQRVAIARALLIQPRLLLMDEPLASLDLPRKLEILPYLEKLKHELDLPILYVSHAPDEVARLADHLVALEQGRVVANGSLSDTLSSLDFPLHLGEEAGVVLEGSIVEIDQEWKLARVNINGADLWLRDGGYAIDSAVRIRILARDISLARQQHRDTSIINSLPCRITQISSDEHAGVAMIQLQLNTTTQSARGNTLLARLTRRSVCTLGLKPGDEVWAQIKSVALL